MKYALVLSLLAFASSAFALEFTAKIDDINCKIENGIVTRTMSFGKETKASFTETKAVKLEGLAPFVQKVVETASNVAEANSEFVFTMTVDGKTYLLNTRESTEGLYLIRMISRICR